MEREPAPVSVKRSSASRYWKARLQVLKRPAVWGAGFLLLLPLIFLANYWRNPTEFVGSQALQPDVAQPPDGSSPVSAETEIAPGVSDASTLLEVPALPDAELTELPQPSLLDVLSTPLPRFDASPSRSTQSTSRSRNPFASKPRTDSSLQNQAETEAGAGLFSFVPSSPLLTSALARPANAEAVANQAGQTNPSLMALNPLQSALDRSAGVVASSPTSETQVDSSSQQQNLTAQTAPNTGQVLPWLVPSGQYARPLGTLPPLSTYIPQTSPFPGTTGYTLPSALRPTSPYSNYPVYPSGAYAGSYPGAYPSFNGYSVTPYTPYTSTVTPGYSTLPLTPMPMSPYGQTGYSTGVPVPNFNTPINTPTTTPMPQAVPFSIPRTPPGRYIGGGEINTFSNP